MQKESYMVEYISGFAEFVLESNSSSMDAWLMILSN